MRALVLGGEGFIGRHVTDRLLAAGHDVTVFARKAQRRDVRVITGDFTDADKVTQAVRNQDWVFHLVSTTLPRSSNENPRLDVESNVGSTLSLLDACVKAGVQKVVFASSGGTVYGVSQAELIAEDHTTWPISSYGITKLTIERYLYLYKHLFGLNYAALRVSNPYGEGQNPHGEQGAVAIFLGRVLRGEPITIWGDGNVIRDYIYVKDVADAFLAAAEARGTADDVFNIGSGEGLSLNGLLAAIREVTGREPVVRYAPSRNLDVPRVVLDITRARTQLGWAPKTTFYVGLVRTWAWISQIARPGR